MTNGTVAEASRGDAVSSVGTAACALPGVAALGADVGTLTVALSAGGSEWSDSAGAPAQLTLYDGAAPPRLDAVEPAALDTSWRAGEVAHALRLRGWNFAPGARCELAGAHFDATLLDAPFGNGSAPHEVRCTVRAPRLRGKAALRLLFDRPAAEAGPNASAPPPRNASAPLGCTLPPTCPPSSAARPSMASPTRRARCARTRSR